MPPLRSLSRSVRSIRSGRTISRNFQTVAEIEFGDEILFHGRSIVEHDTGSNDPFRMIVFSNNRLVNFARSATVFSADGTFKVCPRVYNSNNTNGQLWTIHAFRNGIQIPVFYILMKKRLVINYRVAIEATLIRNNIIPQKFMLDLETAPKTAIEEKFPGCEVSGCFYHFQGVIY